MYERRRAGLYEKTPTGVLEFLVRRTGVPLERAADEYAGFAEAIAAFDTTGVWDDVRTVREGVRSYTEQLLEAAAQHEEEHLIAAWHAARRPDGESAIGALLLQALRDVADRLHVTVCDDIAIDATIGEVLDTERNAVRLPAGASTDARAQMLLSGISCWALGSEAPGSLPEAEAEAVVYVVCRRKSWDSSSYSFPHIAHEYLMALEEEESEHGWIFPDAGSIDELFDRIGPRIVDVASLLLVAIDAMTPVQARRGSSAK